MFLYMLDERVFHDRKKLSRRPDQRKEKPKQTPFYTTKKRSRYTAQPPRWSVKR